MAKKKVNVLGGEINSLTDFRASTCTNPELSERFINDVLRITGLEEDHEGYIVDTEEDFENPDYIVVRGKFLRHANRGILHKKDLIFDPYNNPIIMDELLKQYLQKSHPEIVSAQIMSAKPNQAPKVDTYGYMTLLYSNGAKIQTDMHYKDSTKYLEAYMRLEAMTNGPVREILGIYDAYEKEYFEALENEKVKK
jgi:hypothetical protein